MGGPQGRSGQVRKISPPPGFDPQAVQPVASRYTYWATQPTQFYIQAYIFKMGLKREGIDWSGFILLRIGTSGEFFLKAKYNTGLCRTQGMC